MSDVQKICPHQKPNEFYKFKSKTVSVPDEPEVQETEYTLQHVAQPCAKELCGCWDECTERCGFYKE